VVSRAGHIYTAAADNEAEDNWLLPASVSSYILIWPARHSAHRTGPPFIKAGTVHRVHRCLASQQDVSREEVPRRLSVRATENAGHENAGWENDEQEFLR